MKTARGVFSIVPNAAALKSLAGELGQEHLLQVYDITIPAAVEAFATAVTKCFGAPDLLLNNHWYNEANETNGRLDKKLVRESGYPFEENYGGECPGVYYLRLQRDGWKLQRRESPSPEERIVVFEKPLAKGWILEKSAHASIHHPVGRGCYYDTHRLIHLESGTILNHS